MSDNFFATPCCGIITTENCHLQGPNSESKLKDSMAAGYCPKCGKNIAVTDPWAIQHGTRGKKSGFFWDHNAAFEEYLLRLMKPGILLEKIHCYNNASAQTPLFEVNPGRLFLPTELPEAEGRVAVRFPHIHRTVWVLQGEVFEVSGLELFEYPATWVFIKTFEPELGFVVRRLTFADRSNPQKRHWESFGQNEQQAIDAACEWLHYK